jgi:MarR family transcriptional regulator, 2-MHQ and catechol-resistance regulon repressor
MGTHYLGTEEEVSALDAYIKLMRAADSVTARLNRLLSEHELTISQFGTLEALLHLGPMGQTEIGTKLLKSSGNITMVVDNLEKRGLVRRERGSSDRRCVTVHLTESGRALISEIFPRHAAAIARQMSALEPGEQRELARLCRRLGRHAAGLEPEGGTVR